MNRLIIESEPLFVVAIIPSENLLDTNEYEYYTFYNYEEACIFIYKMLDVHKTCSMDDDYSCEILVECKDYILRLMKL